MVVQPMLDDKVMLHSLSIRFNNTYTQNNNHGNRD